MKHLIDFFIKRSFIVNLVSVFIILAGVIALTSMNRDLIPPFQWSMVTANVSLPGASPKEVEQFITYPIEEATRGLRGLEKVESTSQTGNAQIRFHFSHREMDDAKETVESRINSIRSSLPESIRQITVERAQVNDVFLFWLGLEGFREEDSHHRHLVQRLNQRFSDIPGVVKVSEGYRQRNISIDFDSQMLERYEIPLTQARQVIQENLQVGPIGQTRVGEDQFSVRLEQVSHSLEGLRNLPVRSNRLGRSILLSDIANIDYKLEDTQNHSFLNGKRGSYITIHKDINSDTITLKPKVLEIIDDFNQANSEHFQVITLIDGPHFLEQQLDVLIRNGILGLILVLLILMALLNFKTASMTALGLGIAYTGAFIVLYIFGINIDLLSIVGMILVIGVLVDDAIIVAERYSDYLSSGYTPQKAASQAANDLIIPVTGTVVTTIVAFSPLIFIQGGMAHILFAVPLIVISSLVLSWFESFFILPNHLSHFVKTPQSQRKDNFFKKARTLYESALRVCIRWRYPLAIALGSMVIVGGWIGAKHLEHDFNLNINQEFITVYATMGESDSVESTREALEPIEEFLSQYPSEEVENIYTNIGRVWMDGRIHEGLRYARVNAYINRNAKYPSELKQQIQEETDQFLTTLDQSNFESLRTRIQMQGGEEDVGQMLRVRVRGGDQVNFSDIETSIVSVFDPSESIGEYVPDPERFQETWVFEPTPSALARYQLSPRQVTEQIRGAFVPHFLSETRMGGENINVYTELNGRKDISFEQLNALKVISTNGLSVPIHYLGNWRKERNLRQINHYDGARMLPLDFRLGESGNINSAISEADEVLSVVREAFPAYEINVVNADEQQAQSQAWALKVALVCIAGVLLVISLVSGSITQSLLVGLPIPFSVVGVIIALYLHGLPLGLMALVGLVGTIGVGVNASIVMVDQINKLTAKREGRISREDLIEGASSRFRAIVLTSLTTLAGVFPMAYAIGGESGFTQPLAFSLGWGIAFSTMLILFALPSLLQIREDIFVLAHKVIARFTKDTPSKPVIIPVLQSDQQKNESKIKERVLASKQKKKAASNSSSNSKIQ